MAATFGIGSFSAGGMIVNKFSISESAQVAESRDANGKVVARQAYSVTKDVSADGPLEGAAPSAGETGTICGVSVLIESVSTSGSNEGFQQLSVSGKSIDGVAGTGIS